MHTRRMSAEAAVGMVRRRRAEAAPNRGFMAQLQLYEQVGFEIDTRWQAVRRFVMSNTHMLNGDSMHDMLLSYYPSAYASAALCNLSTDCESNPKIWNPPPSTRSSCSPASITSPCNTLATMSSASPSASTSASTSTPNSSGGLPGGVAHIRAHQRVNNRGALLQPKFSAPNLRCKRCSTVLAALDHVVLHEPPKRHMAFEHRTSHVGASTRTAATTLCAAANTTPIESAACLASQLPPHLAALCANRAPPPAARTTTSMLKPTSCSSYFVEPMAWMSQLGSGELTGTLNCPNAKCAHKLGSWDWAGVQCGCGAWVTPAFSLHTSKVDEM